jgi:hypothetical protein
MDRSAERDEYEVCLPQEGLLEDITRYLCKHRNSKIGRQTNSISCCTQIAVQTTRLLCVMFLTSCESIDSHE